jgi:NAD(P)-dependent dehydrogenase (short-subunit alcohol dehydrogenase family)
MSTQPGVAWIVGGGSGIGAAMARMLADRGWTVAISGRRQEALDETARHNPTKIIAYALDVTDCVAIQRVVRQVGLDHRQIDLFIYGAAAWQPMDVGDYDAAKFQQIVDTNLMGLVRMSNPVTQEMAARGGGQFAIIASVAGYFGLPRAAAYNATKAALISLAQSMRTELKPKGIAVRLVSPGFFKSPLTAKNDFPMPFLLETDEAAERTLDGLLNSAKFEVAFPRRMAWILKVLRILPYPLAFAITDKMMPK